MSAGAPPAIVTARGLNRAVLARQLLLDRADIGIEAALVQVGGLQTQYSPSGYVGLWSRLRTFARDDLTRALEERRAIQGTLMRGTIHLVAPSDYWPFAIGIQRALRDAAARAWGPERSSDLRRGSEPLRVALADGPRSVAELDGLAAGFIGNLGLWVALVRVPPSGTWQRRRADRLALAESWVGPCDATEEEGLTALVRSYLRGFGPAPLRDVAGWAGIPVRDAARGASNLALEHFVDEAGRELVDLPGAPRPDPDSPAPVRFLPPYDTMFFAHTRRGGILPDEHRTRILNTRNAASLGAVLVDGRALGGWFHRNGRVVVETFEPLPRAATDAIEAERAELERFYA